MVDPKIFRSIFCEIPHERKRILYAGITIDMNGQGKFKYKYDKFALNLQLTFSRISLN